MKAKPNAALIGMFVTGAAVLGVAAVFYFGGRTWMSETGEFVVYFDESVHGLDVGAPVKFRGVRFGRVKEIAIRHDSARGRSLVPVVCEVDRQIILDAEGNRVDLSDPAVVRDLVDRGLRARLSLVGLSGLMYIELDYASPSEAAEYGAIPDSGRPAIPSVPSLMVGLTEGVAGVTADLGDVDFAGLARKFEGVLDQVETRLDALDVETLSANLNQAAASIAELAESDDLYQAVRSANAAFSELTSILQRLEEQIDPVSERFMVTADELSTTLNQLGGAVEAIESIISPRTGIGSELATTLDRLGDAARSVQRLADYLERNPNALLSGRREGPQ